MINRFDSARKFASKIVESKKLTPPIDPSEIIKTYGIEIIEEENQLGIEAYSKLDENPYIAINSEFTFPARKKFTLAHELGHIIIPWHNGDIKCDTDKPYNIIEGRRLLDTQELEANIFASELLMPHNWIIEQTTENNCSFQDTINRIKSKAQTSVMACLYALEEALPSGNLYYVKKDNSDYWKKFSSKRTCSVEIYSDFETRIKFLKRICENMEHFRISQYEIVYFDLLTSPSKTTIRKVYSESKDIVECINIISDYEPLKVFSFLKDLLNDLEDVFCCIIFENKKFLRTITHSDSKLRGFSLDYDCLIRTFKTNLLEYYLLEIDEFRFVFIKEYLFDLMPTKEADPNSLLKDIVKELYPNNSLKMLQRINGIVSSVNSKIKIDDEQLLYNTIKYRFAGAYDMIDFYNHSDFEMYIVNKTKSMIFSRRNK